MLVARHRRSGLIAIEAFELGIDVPLLRRPDGSWEPGWIGVEELADEFEDLAFSPEEARRLIGVATSVWKRFQPALSHEALDGLSIERVRDVLASRLGSAVIDERSVKAPQAALSSAVPEMPVDYVQVHVAAEMLAKAH